MTYFLKILFLSKFYPEPVLWYDTLYLFTKGCYRTVTAVLILLIFFRRDPFMGYIDLHVHSNASDGTMTPEEVVDCAAKAGLSAIALTDHDTTAGVSKALAAEKKRRDAGLFAPAVIPGTELSCSWFHDGKETEIHILGLFIEPEQKDFKAFLEDMISARESRNSEILRRLAADGILLSMEDLTEGISDTVITRAHFASALIKRGYVSTVEQAFKRYLVSGGTYCPLKKTVDPKDAISLILKAGGFPVFAHPMRYHLSWREIEALTAELSGAGLQGVEVYYSSHTAEQSRRLRSLCHLFHLLPTGGSDFHGAKKPDIHIGTGYGGMRVSDLLLKDIIEFRANGSR